METRKPTLSFDSVHGRVPPYSLSNLGHQAADEFIKPPADIALPARHSSNVFLYWSVSICLRNLRIPARKELWFGFRRRWQGVSYLLRWCRAHAIRRPLSSYLPVTRSNMSLATPLLDGNSVWTVATSICSVNQSALTSEIDTIPSFNSPPKRPRGPGRPRIPTIAAVVTDVRPISDILWVDPSS